MKKNFLIIHHIDNDGYASMAVLEAYLKMKDIDSEIDCVGWNYGRQVNKELFDKSWEHIYIVDLHLPDMAELFKDTSHEVTICDHHKTFVESEDYKKLRDMENITLITLNEYPGFAACEIIWAYVTGNPPSSRDMSMLLRIRGFFGTIIKRTKNERIK